MTTSKSLSDPDRTALLGDLASLKTDDDDAVEQDPKWFLPLDAHARALRPETLVVRGGRGAGKTALFHFLSHLQRDPSLGSSVGMSLMDGTKWIEGFSTTTATHPHAQVLMRFAESADDARRRYFWFGWLCARISRGANVSLPSEAIASALYENDPETIAMATEQELTALSAWLDDVERKSAGPMIVTYDGLDRIGMSATSREQLTASLLAMWLALADRYRRVRAKVFVREDLFAASVSAFPDASKLEARSVSIEWRIEDLYRVLIKHMANVSERLATWIQDGSRKVPLHEEGGLGLMPPPTLPETGKISQKAFVDHLAGEMMGSGAKKGLTYRWIPNRLQDAHSRVVPRSILSLVRNAARFALDRGSRARNLRLLHPEELQGALEHTSKRRVAELEEEFPVVARLEHLRGETVMLDRKTAVKALSKPPSTQDDEHGTDGEQVLQALIDIGAMSVRLDGRVDVPDIYRYGFGILRRGGVRRPR